jgi:pimeloyl-ACP methyl ester carboxylesterase
MKNPPLVLLPGLLCNESIWQSIDAIAKTKNITTLPLALDQGKNIEKMAQSVLTQTPQQFDLLGFSLGAMLSCYIAITAGARIRKLVLLSMNSGHLKASTKNSLEQLKTRLAQGDDKALAEISLAYQHPHSAPHFIAWYQSMAKAMGTKIGLLQLNILLGKEITDFEKITCPTLVVAGSKDNRTPPEQQQELAKKIPNCSYKEIPDAGHFSFYDQPQLVNEAIFSWL